MMCSGHDYISGAGGGGGGGGLMFDGQEFGWWWWWLEYRYIYWVTTPKWVGNAASSTSIF